MSQLQAIQSLQNATQLWMQRPDSDAKEAVHGLTHFPAVIQTLIQVSHPPGSPTMPYISRNEFCLCLF